MHPSRFSFADMSAAQILEAEKSLSAFEEAWKAGRFPRVDDFLGGFLEPQRQKLRAELQAIELDYRRRPMWKYALDGQRVGPVSWLEIEKLLAQGVLTPEDMVLNEGTQKWFKLASVLSQPQPPVAAPLPVPPPLPIPSAPPPPIVASAPAPRPPAPVPPPAATAPLRAAAPPAAPPVAPPAPPTPPRMAPPMALPAAPPAVAVPPVSASLNTEFASGSASLATTPSRFESASPATVSLPPAPSKSASQADRALDWFYYRNQVPVGPFSFEQLQKLAQAGDIRPKDIVCRRDSTELVEASTLPELFAPLGKSEFKAPAPGQRVRDDYLLLDRVGKGGMAEVYKAYRISFRKEVALKIVRFDWFERLAPNKQQQVLRHFQTEMQVTARLRHDNIVSIFDAGEHQRLPYYTMDYIEDNLARRVQHGPLPGRTAAQYMEKIARAVDFAHHGGIVHRDIKPHNILLDKDKPLLADLGLARLWEDLEEGQVAGTPAYMAPKGEAQGRKADPRSDVYGLGATLYHLITGRPPYQGSDREQTLKLLASKFEPLAPRRLNPAIDRDLTAITLKCLEKDPQKRYPTAGALADDLERYREHRPVLAKNPNLFERMWKWARRDPFKAASLVAIAILLLTLIITQAWKNARLASDLEIEETARLEADKRREAETAARLESDKRLAAEERQRLAEARERKEIEESNRILSLFAARTLNQFKPLEDAEAAVSALEKNRDKLMKGPLSEKGKLDLQETLKNLSVQYQLANEDPRTRDSKARDALRECIALQEELCKKNKALQLDLAINYRILGGIHAALGESKAEVEADEKALAVLGELRKSGSFESVIVGPLAEAYSQIGSDFTRQANYKKAQEYYWEAVQILERHVLKSKDTEGGLLYHSFQNQLGMAYLAYGKSLRSETGLDWLKKSEDVFAGHVQFRKKLAEVNLAVGLTYLEMKPTAKPASAVKPLQDALAILEALLAEYPTEAAKPIPYQQSLVESQAFLARALQSIGRGPEAVRLLQPSLKTRRALAARGNKVDLVNGLVDLAHYYKNAMDEDAALAHLEEALPLQEEWLARGPGDPSRSHYLGHMLHLKGDLLMRQKKYAEARKSFLAAKSHEITAYELSKTELYEHNLFITYTRVLDIHWLLKDLDEARRSLAERKRFWPATADTWKGVPEVHARLLNILSDKCEPGATFSETKFTGALTAKEPTQTHEFAFKRGRLYVVEIRCAKFVGDLKISGPEGPIEPFALDLLSYRMIYTCNGGDARGQIVASRLGVGDGPYELIVREFTVK